MQAVRQGQWVLLDEINLAPLEVLESLNCILDDTGFIVVESGYVAIFLTVISIYQYCTLVISVAAIRLCSYARLRQCCFTKFKHMEK